MIKSGRFVLILLLVSPIVMFFQNCGSGWQSKSQNSKNSNNQNQSENERSDQSDVYLQSIKIINEKDELTPEKKYLEIKLNINSRTAETVKWVLKVDDPERAVELNNSEGRLELEEGSGEYLIKVPNPNLYRSQINASYTLEFFRGEESLGISNLSSVSILPIDAAPNVLSQIDSVTSYGECLIKGGLGYCEGRNSFGELGNGKFGSVFEEYPFQRVVDVDNFLEISVGSNFRCGLTLDQKVYCWGIKNNGVLGQDFTNPLERNSRPQLITGLPGKTLKLAATYYTVCTIQEDQNVYCWGSNRRGQLGIDDATLKYSLSPVKINLPSKVIDLGITSNRVCALTSEVNEDNKLYCWWSTTTDFTTGELVGPEHIPDFDGTEVITSSRNAICGIKRSKINCFSNSNAWVEPAENSLDVRTFQIPTPPEPPVKLILASRIFCALSAQGNLFCFGDNKSYNFKTDSDSDWVSDWRKIYENVELPFVARHRAICAQTRISKEVICSRSAESDGGILGQGNFLVEAHFPIMASLKSNSKRLTGDFNNTERCSITSENKWECWGGDSDRLRAPRERPFYSDKDQIASVSHTSCYLQKGNVFCSGRLSGQIEGDSIVSEFHQVAGLSDISKIVVRTHNVCALGQGKNLYCWGDASKSQLLGYGKSHTNTPVNLGDFIDAEGILDVSVSDYGRICILDSDKKMACWGNNTGFGLGRGEMLAETESSSEIGYLNLPDKVKEIAQNQKYVCANLENGEVYCWGTQHMKPYNIFITNNTPSKMSLPNEIEFKANSIVAGSSHMCAIKDKTAWCWGANQGLALGRANQSLWSHTPVKYEYLEGMIEELIAGNQSTCARLGTGKVMCWGLRSRSGNTELLRPSKYFLKAGHQVE